MWDLIFFFFNSAHRRLRRSHAYSLITFLFFSSIWREEPFSLDVQTLVPNFAASVSWLKMKLDSSVFGLACIVMWNIWNFRNERLHDAIEGNQDLVVARSQEFLNSFHLARFCFAIGQVAPATASWQTPNGTTIKINFDAAVFDSCSYQVGRWLTIPMAFVGVGQFESFLVRLHRWLRKLVQHAMLSY